MKRGAGRGDQVQGTRERRSRPTMSEGRTHPDTSEQEAFEQLQLYTLAHGNPAFVHQHVVDAWAAQRADERTKPITLAFALVGLYLHVEMGFSGRLVQRVHMALARNRRSWPAFEVPRERGAFTASHVMSAPAGHERDRAIDAWCTSVWQAFRESRDAVADLLKRYGVV